jgi:hypothetical protein
VSDAVRIGEDLAEELLERGADSILHDIRASVPHPQRPPAP